ncbi:hypothetical protein BC828DRAFT_392366 [Blastocladiella britannica]|nr:hypothetical protein BC828DRAFT_392366 [Blastocladiella britannica]
MLMVAYLYQEGGSDAFEQDLEKAYEWYSAAAAKGSASALCVMAQLHAQGMVDDASPAKAVELYEQAFNELNSSEALVGLSALYMDDTFAGLQQDVPKALALLEQAAAMDDDEAMLTLGQLYLGEMSEQVSADHALARKWLEAAADRDNTDALNTLGFLHFSGEAGYAKDVDMAISLHERAAGLKEIEAMNLLGQLYFSGVEGDVEIDFAKSMHWFKKAAAHGSALAMSTIGDMYEEGMGVDKDEKLAAEWHAKAEEAGDDEDWEDDCCDDEDCDGCGDDHEHEQDHDEE